MAARSFTVTPVLGPARRRRRRSRCPRSRSAIARAKDRARRQADEGRRRQAVQEGRQIEQAAPVGAHGAVHVREAVSCAPSSVWTTTLIEPALEHTSSVNCRIHQRHCRHAQRHHNWQHPADRPRKRVCSSQRVHEQACRAWRQGRGLGQLWRGPWRPWQRVPPSSICPSAAVLRPPWPAPAGDGAASAGVGAVAAALISTGVTVASARSHQRGQPLRVIVTAAAGTPLLQALDASARFRLRSSSRRFIRRCSAGVLSSRTTRDSGFGRRCAPDIGQFAGRAAPRTASSLSSSASVFRSTCNGRPATRHGRRAKSTGRPAWRPPMTTLDVVAGRWAGALARHAASSSGRPARPGAGGLVPAPALLTSRPGLPMVFAGDALE